MHAPSVHVFAASGPVDAARVDRGIEVMRGMGVGPIGAADNLYTREGYFAGDDASRLQSVLAGLDADVLWSARGGYGATRILGRLDPERVAASRSVMIGFSDTTALLCRWLRCGGRGIHGPVVGQLAEVTDDDRDRLTTWLAGEVPSPLEATEGSVVFGGRVEGKLVAGNVEVLRSLVGTGDFPDLRGCILALEEVGERPYRLDRALTHMLEAGALRGLAGLVIGQLRGCVEPSTGGSQGADALEVIEDRLGRLGVPLVSGFPFGHDPKRNSPLAVGVKARLHADDATLEFLEPVRGHAS